MLFLPKKFLVLVLSAVTVPGFAQQFQSPVFGEATVNLEPVVVTATRQPTALENMPGQVEVVTAQDIAKRNVNRLTDVLNMLPGLAVQPGRGPLQGIQSMSLRGIPDERRMQILLDGVSLNDGYAGSVNLAGLPVSMIERAEVLVGPASSLYGGTAMSGVVSYTTRMPKADQFDLSIGYGNPFSAGKAPENVRRVSLSAGTRFDNELSVLAGGSWMATDGYRNDLVVTTTAPAGTLSGWSSLPFKTGANGYLLGNKGRTEWEENGEYLKLEQRISGVNRWRFAWSRQAYTTSSIDPQTYMRTTATGLPSWGASEVSFLSGAGAYERNIYSLGGDMEMAGGLLKLTASYLDVPTNFTVTPTGTVSGGAGRVGNTISDTRSVDAFWNKQLGVHALTLGGSWRQDRALAEDFSLSNWRDPGSRTALYAKASGQASSLGAYVQDEWQISTDLLAHLGLRYDSWQNDKGSVATPGWTSGQIFKDYPSHGAVAWSPKLAVRYQLQPGFAVRTSYGSAFRAPSVYELYRSSKIGLTTYSANPELKPETVRTLDLGAELMPWRGAEVKLTFFKNRMEDFIYTEGGSSTTKTRINAELAESQGFTLGFSQKLGLESHLFASYTHTASEVKKNSRAPTSVGKMLTFLPKNQATLGADTLRGPWTLAANVRYASKQYASDDNSDIADKVPGVYDAYVLADMKVTYQFDKRFAGSLAIDNLFNREYFSFYQAPGRNWFASLSYKY